MDIYKNEIKGKKFEYLPEVAQMSHEINDILINSSENNLSIHSIRFLLILIANLKEHQLSTKQTKQLNLFDEYIEALNENIEISTSSVFNISCKYSHFLPKGNKNYESVKQALNELENFKYKLKVEVNKGSTDRHKPHRIIESNLRLIQNTFYDKNRGFRITLDRYWFRALINLTVHSNKYLKSIAFNFRSLKTYQFYFYLKKLDTIDFHNDVDYREIKDKLGDNANQYKGTRKNIEKFIELFNIPYTSSQKSRIIKYFLDPMRDELNKYADISFNYKFKNDLIIILAYEPGRALIKAKVTSTEARKIKLAVNYKVAKYNLNEEEIKSLYSIYLYFTYDFVSKATFKKSIKGLSHIDSMMQLLENYKKKYNIDIKTIFYSKEEKEEIKKFLKLD